MSETATKPARFKRQMILLDTLIGKREVEALVLGKLAVTPRLLFNGNTEPGSYNVTHVPTGMSVRIGKSLNEARTLAGALQHLDWDFDTPEVPLETRRGTVEICKRLRL